MMKNAMLPLVMLSDVDLVDSGRTSADQRAPISLIDIVILRAD